MLKCIICNKLLKEEDACECPSNEGFYFCLDCLDKNGGSCPICN